VKRFLGVLALILCMCAGATVFAQEDSGSGRFSEGQRLLNQQAFEATSENDFKKAEGLYKSMLLLGEHNVTYLNLGRAYLKQGKCMEAASTLNKVESAPQVEGVPLEGILARLTEYREEMTELCTARMVLDCKPKELLVSIDSGEEFVCHEAPIPMSPGNHTFIMRYQYPGNPSFDNAATMDDLTANEITTVQLTVENSAEMIRCGGMTYEEREQKSKLFKILGWSFVAVGAIGVAGSAGWLGYEFLDIRESLRKHNDDPEFTEDEHSSASVRKEKFDKNKLYAFIGIGIGSAFAITGITLLIFDAIQHSGDCTALACAPKKGLELYPVFGAGSDGANFGLNLKF
jgi:hypothetical protein